MYVDCKEIEGVKLIITLVDEITDDERYDTEVRSRIDTNHKN